MNKAQIIFPAFAISIFVGNGLRTIDKRADYAGKITKSKELEPYLNSFFVMLGVIQLAIALPMGYFVFWLFG